MAAACPATLETGAVVRVPLFVQTGELVKVDTRNGEYVSRAGEVINQDNTRESVV